MCPYASDMRVSMRCAAILRCAGDRDAIFSAALVICKALTSQSAPSHKRNACRRQEPPRRHAQHGALTGVPSRKSMASSRLDTRPGIGRGTATLLRRGARRSAIVVIVVASASKSNSWRICVASSSTALGRSNCTHRRKHSSVSAVSAYACQPPGAQDVLGSGRIAPSEADSHVARDDATTGP